MKLDRIAFALISALLLLVGALWLVPEPPETGGSVHPQFATLQIAGAPAPPAILLIAAAFGAVMFVLLAVLMAWAVRRSAGGPRLTRPLVVATLVVLAMWALLFLVDGAGNGEGRQYLAFPAGTAILVYLLFPATGLFNLAFVLGFPRAIFGRRDSEWLERRQQEREQERGRERATAAAKPGRDREG